MEKRLEHGQIESPETQENYSSRVLLHFFRHGEKENNPNLPNEELRLSSRGRQQGLDRGRNRPEARDTAIAFGSQMARAQEMAGFDLAGAKKEASITGEETLDELKAKLNQDLKFGSKIGVDPKLGFSYEPEYEKPSDVAFTGKRYLDFAVNESDALARKLGDKTSTTYSRAAGNVAEVLRRYLTITPRFDQLVKSGDKDYGRVLERFMGSHAGVIDLFFTKLVDKMKGPAVRDKLMAALGNHAFDFGEGFDVEIDSLPDQTVPVIRIAYHKKGTDGQELFSFNEVVPQKLLDELIEEGKE